MPCSGLGIMYSVVMEGMQITFVVFNLITSLKCVLGDAMAFFPPEARAVNQYQFIHPQFQPVSRNVVPPGYILTHEHAIPHEQMEPQEQIQPIIHTSAVNTLVPPPVPDRPLEGLNYSFIETPRQIGEDFRASKSGYDYPTHPTASYPQAPSYGYSPSAPNYSPPATAPSPPSYAPPSPAHQSPTATSKFSILKPDLTSLIKPVTTKVAGKVSGLLGLILSLFSGTAVDDLEMKGFKDIVINGIVKPLLIAKGGIKSLISKMTIPVISLLLINLEVLITVWWLWEECPAPIKPAYEYTKPTYTPNYNSYR